MTFLGQMLPEIKLWQKRANCAKKRRVAVDARDYVNARSN